MARPYKRITSKVFQGGGIYESTPLTVVYKGVETAQTTAVLNAAASVTTGTTTITTFTKQPGAFFSTGIGARNVTLTPTGTTADVTACNVVITGTDIGGVTVTDTLAFNENQSTATIGVVAFKTLASAAIPAQDGAGATWSFGVGSKLGLPQPSVAVLKGIINDVADTTAPTVVLSSTVTSSNTVTLSTALNGSDIKVIYIPK